MANVFRRRAIKAIGGAALTTGLTLTAAAAREQRIIYSETRWRFLQRAGLLAGAFIGCVVAAAFFVYAGGSALAATMAEVDAARLTKADQDAANWLSYGRTYSEQRFSPLARITADNAKKLGLAWYADFDSNRGQEATPLIIDGAMYVSTAWSIVRAFDAKTGRPLWSYDPGVPRELGVRGCCDVVNRGVAAWKGKIYLGTFDGRLVALDARHRQAGLERRDSRPEQALHDHYGAPRHQRPGGDWQQR
jgi:glucose dehydrogenase